MVVKVDNDESQTQCAKVENKNLLSQFWSLASLDNSSRISSVVNIVSELKTSGKKVELDYSVERLVKGLSSSRKAARQGYATALTHIMKEFSDITTDVVLELMAKHLVVTGALKRQEERDNYFGQVFGFLSICKAKFQEDATSTSFETVLEKLVSLMKKKSYIQEICGKAICDIIKMVDFEAYECHMKSVLEPILTKGWIACTPEELMIVVTIEQKFRNDLPKKYFKDSWDKSYVLHKENFSSLSKVLMDTTNTAHPRVHILWDQILEYIENISDEKFESFWKIVVEDGLLQSTHERKFLAINVMLKLLPKISPIQVDVIFSQSLLRCIINSCQSKDNYLYNAVKDVLKKLPRKVEENQNQDITFCVIKQLVGRNGHVCFDSITHTKTIEQLVMKMKSNLMEYFGWLVNVFNNGSTDFTEPAKILTEKDITICRNWVLNQLPVLVHCCKLRNEEKLIIQISSFLFLHSYFVLIKKNKKMVLLNNVPTHPISDTTHEICKQKFSTVLTDITNIHWAAEQGKKAQFFGGVAQDEEFYAMKLLNYAQVLLNLPKYVSLKKAWTPEVFEAFNNTMESIANIKTEVDEHIAKTKGAQLLFIHTTLQLFSNREEAVDILQEIHTCYKKAEEKKKLKKKEPHWTEVLTEILLGFLSQPSHLLRQVVDMVFPSIAPHLTQEAFEQLINAIKPKNKVEDDGFEVVDSDNEEQENGDVKEEVNSSDEGIVDVKEEDDSEDEDESDESEDEDSEMEVDAEFKAELKAALGGSAVSSEDEDKASEDGEEDIDMDTCDPKLLAAMDQALASVFKSREQKQVAKKNKKMMNQSVVHFKLRVLDLFEIFIRKQQKDPKILQLLDPLLAVLKTSHGHTDELALFERTLGIYKNKLCQLHDYPSGVDLNVENIHGQIEQLVKLAKTASSALFVTYITQGIVYLIRVLRGNPEVKGPSPLKTRAQRKRRETIVPPVVVKMEHSGCLDEKRVSDCCNEALNEFMLKRSSHLQPMLFLEIIQRFPDIGWKFASSIPQYLNSGCNNFRKVKACEMLKLLFSKKTNTFTDNLLEISDPLLDHVIKTLDSTKDEKNSLKARQIHDIIQLADIFAKEVKKNETVQSIVNFENLRAAVENSLDNVAISRSPALQSYCKQFVTSLENIDNPLVKSSSKKKKKK